MRAEKTSIHCLIAHPQVKHILNRPSRLQRLRWRLWGLMGTSRADASIRHRG